MSKKRHIVQLSNRTTAGMPMTPQCPYLVVNDERKVCKRMEERGTNGEVSDFDVQHYCQGNPVNCFYFRTSEEQTGDAPEKTLRRKLSQIFTNP